MAPEQPHTIERGNLRQNVGNCRHTRLTGDKLIVVLNAQALQEVELQQ